MKVIAFITTILAALIASVPTPALADRLTCCNGRGIKWNDVTQTWKTTSNWATDRKAVIQEVANRWNEINGSTFRITLANDDDSVVSASGDGNEIGWLPDSWPEAPGIIAITVNTYNRCASDCSRIGDFIESNIWVYGSDRVGGVSRPRIWTLWPPIMQNQLSYSDFIFSTVMSHELGHAVGLQHTSHGMARMESHMPAGGGFHSSVAQTRRVTPLAWEALDMNVLYPPSSFVAAPVISAVQIQNNWAVIEPLPRTETNELAQSIPLSMCPGTGICMTRPNPREANPGWFFPRNRTLRNSSTKQMRPGDKVDIRICAINRGQLNFTAPIPIKVYFSTDANITLADTETLDGYSFATGIARHESPCRDLLITTPLVPAGYYWIGYSLDTRQGVDADTTDNVNLINNAVYVLPL